MLMKFFVAWFISWIVVAGLIGTVFGTQDAGEGVSAVVVIGSALFTLPFRSRCGQPRLSCRTGDFARISRLI